MSRSIEQLVNQQVLRWTREQRLTEESSPASERGLQRPMICISRQFGGLGGEIGRLAAERLGFRFYAQEIVHEIARHAAVRQQVVESLDERLQGSLDGWVNRLIEGGGFSPTEYVRNLSQVVLALGRHGKGVIIGRGAHLILDSRYTLRLRCYASAEHRAQYIAERDGMTEAEAHAKLQRVDAERIAFHHRHFNVDVTEPGHYDLLLNTGTLSVAECVEIVVKTFEARFSAPTSRVRLRKPEVPPEVQRRAI